ncbi:MAG TPA: IPT/TIG domain-containing protein [Solirubrobacterales bacterium]
MGPTLHTAPLVRLAVGLVAALVLCLALAGSSASATSTYVPGTPPSFCSPTGGPAAGECGELKTIAVDASNGHVYVADQTNLRIDEFDASGSFVKAFGSGVLTGVAGAEVCTVTCKKGLSTGTGSFGNPIRGLAVDPTTHVVYVAASTTRIAYFNGTTGAYISSTEGNAGETNAGAPETLALTAGLAIDSTTAGGPYLYAAINTGTNPEFKSFIDKFTITASGIGAGSYVCQISGTAVASKSATAVAPTECGGNGVTAHKDGAYEGILIGNASAAAVQRGGNLAVDASGNVYIAESPATLASVPAGRHVVSKFDKEGNYVTQFLPSGGTPPLSATEPRPESLAITGAGKLLVAVGGATGGAGGTRVQEYEPNIAPATPPTIAVGTPVAEFGQGTIAAAGGVAATGTDAFVASKTEKKVLKYSLLTGKKLKVQKSGAGSGTVTSEPAGINCGTECEKEFSEGEVVKLTQSASLGSGFKEWVGCDEIVETNKCKVTLSSDKTVTAVFIAAPIVTTTNGATNVTPSKAKVAGTVNPNGIPVTSCEVEYGTSLPSGTTKPCVPTPGSGSSPEAVSAEITSGLSANTTYKFRFFATNAAGKGEGTEGEFKTAELLAPVVETKAATAVQKTSATLNGSVNPKLEEVTSCKLEYGPSAGNYSLGQVACSPAPGSGNSPVDVSGAISGLEQNTTYHFRVVASNAGGTSNGNDKEFTTASVISPTVTTTAGATSITKNSAKVAGTVNPNGVAVTSCEVEYGTPNLSSPSKTACVPTPGSGSSPEAVSADLSALTPNATYKFRFVASNGEPGTGQGSEQEFKTLPEAPSITSINPTKGPLTAGTQVTITGTNLGSATSVKFASGTATITENTATQIKVTLPGCTAGAKDLRVVTAGGESSNTSADDYTCTAAPSITSINPAKGPLTAGTQVTITGTNLGSATSVKFGSGTATITENTATQIKVTLPACTAGAQDIRVVTAGGESSNTSADDYTCVGPLALTVSKAGSGSGAVTCDGGPCASSYPYGAKVTLAASADSGSSFAGWSGACSGTGDCVVMIEAATSVTATFNANPSSGGGGGGGGTTPPPSNEAKPGSAKPQGQNMILKVTVPGAGTLRATGKNLATATATAKGAGTASLKLKLTSAGKKALKKKGKLKVKVKIVFTPVGGTAGTTTKTVTFKAKKG